MKVIDFLLVLADEEIFVIDDLLQFPDFLLSFLVAAFQFCYVAAGFLLGCLESNIFDLLLGLLQLFLEIMDVGLAAVLGHFKVLALLSQVVTLGLYGLHELLHLGRLLLQTLVFFLQLKQLPLAPDKVFLNPGLMLEHLFHALCHVGVLLGELLSLLLTGA